MDEYKRALQLTGDCIKSGKFEALKKFGKVTQVKEIRELVSRVFQK